MLFLPKTAGVRKDVTGKVLPAEENTKKDSFLALSAAKRKEPFHIHHGR